MSRGPPWDTWGNPPHLAALLVMHLALGKGGVPGVEEAKHYHLGGVRKQ